MKKIIYIVCDSGITSSVMINKINDLASEDAPSFNFVAIPASCVEEKIMDNKASVILLSPQVRFLKEKFDLMYNKKGITIYVIPKKDYATLNAKAVILFVKKILSE